MKHFLRCSDLMGCSSKGLLFRRTKKKRGIFLLLAILLIGAILFAGGGIAAEAYTQEEEEALEELDEQVKELLEALDTEDLQEYLDSLEDYQGTDIKESISDLITGDFSLDYTSLWQSVLSLVWQEGRSMLPAFAVILAATLLCGILNSAKNGFLHSTMSDIINFSAYISVGAVVLAVLSGLLQTGFSAMESMCTQMEIVYPLLLTLMAASGGSVSAGVFRPAVAFLSSGI